MPQTRKFSICLLDDKIPLSLDSGLIDHRELNVLASDDTKWKDAELLSLVKQLDIKKDNYILSGFLHCNHFLSYIEDVIFSPDIIVFDWDYDGQDPTDSLLKILERQYSMVFIFSAADKETEIDNVLAKDKFVPYKNRLEKIMKGDTNSVATLQTKIDTALASFSFKYGNELKQKTIKGLDLILGSLGQLSFEEFIRFFGEEREEEVRKTVNGREEKEKVFSYQLSSFELTEILADKLRSQIVGNGMNLDELSTVKGKIICNPTFEKSKITNLIVNNGDGATILNGLEQNNVVKSISEEKVELLDVWKNKETEVRSVAGDRFDAIWNFFQQETRGYENSIRNILNFRLYHQPKDGYVRRGDIVEINGEKVLIISSDCDLSRFWQKNMGCLMLTPLLRIDNASLKKDLNTYNGDNISKFKITSLTNPRFIESFTILPGLEIEDNGGVKKCLDYVVAAKATRSVPIKKPDAVTDVKTALKYEHIEGIGESFKIRKRVAEPFLTPLIQFILDNLTGFGVPDFPKNIQESLKTNIRGLKNNAGT